MIGVAERENKTSLLKRLTGKLDVMLTIFTHQNIHVSVMRSIMALAKESKHNINWSPIEGEALIDRARSRAASYFLLNSKDDVLCFLDEDVIFKPSDLTKIIDAIACGADICGGPYIQKGTLGKTWVQFDGQEITFGKGSKPVEVEAVATGFMAIHRRVFEQLAKDLPLCHPGTINFYPFFQPFPALKKGKWVYLGEDWAMCERARKVGFKVFLEPSIFLGHEGNYIYDFRDADLPRKCSWEQFESITLK